MARRSVTTIDLSGPFFKKDPAKTFRANARSMMRGLALEGERDVRAQLLVGEGARVVISQHVRPVRVSQHARAGVPFTPGGKNQRGIIRVHVYVPNFGFTKAEGQALMAAYGTVEHETGAFRRTTNRLRRAKKLNAAELLKGLT